MIETRVPAFCGRPPRSRRNLLTQAEAVALAARLAEAWSASGWQGAEFRVEHGGIFMNTTNWVVRSNLVNGVPPR